MSRRSLARSAALVGGFYVLSNIAGFVARLLINARFGAGAEQDAFRAAFVIPDLMFNVLAGGALASAFIPVYVGRLSRGERDIAQRLARAVAQVVFGVLSALALIAAASAPALIHHVVARQFSPAQVALTASLMRIMLLATVIFGVSGLLMGVLQSNEAFLAPAIAPSLYQLGMILGATALSGLGVYGLAVGVVLGALMHIGVQLPSLRSVLRLSSVAAPAHGAGQNASHATPRVDHAVRSDLRQILTLMPPRMLGLGAVQLNNLVNTTLASGIPGGVSAFNNAFAILVLPIAVIGQAVGTALFPAISAHAARGEGASFATSFTRALNAVIALSLPAAVGLIILGQPLIRLLFERGAFDARSTEWVAFALALLAIGLPAHVALEVVTRAFYALKDSARPAMLAVFSVALNILLSVGLYQMFDRAGRLPFGGLALANALATILETLILYALLVRRAERIQPRSTWVAFGKSGLAALAMGITLWGWVRLAGDGAPATIAAIILGAAAYFGVALMLRSEEALFAARGARKWFAR
ncbi:murein biosynthesis integral membrane protein MurJ [Candidatus Roseilinea sp. NK_OTU-006]|jgi:putative peptidoglycan lipid II flippase|nr:murein biosynthesis integral membrane protein MurJ [Candidatus Roseilinea sp. NK_OTU-006]